MRRIDKHTTPWAAPHQRWARTVVDELSAGWVWPAGSSLAFLDVPVAPVLRPMTRADLLSWAELSCQAGEPTGSGRRSTWQARLSATVKSLDCPDLVDPVTKTIVQAMGMIITTGFPMQITTIEYLSYRQNQGSTSLVRFSDAQLLFIPMQTNSGMTWLASAKRLVESGVIPSEKERESLASCIKFPLTVAAATPLIQTSKGLNIQIGSAQVTLDSALPLNSGGWLGPKDLRSVFDRCVIVPEENFGAVANNTLAVYTSVAIDSSTGSAKPGALFSIEGVSRSSVFVFEIGYIDPETQGVERFINEKTPVPSQLPGILASLKEIVASGLVKFEILGVGGKRSRGFGRLKVWPILPVLLDRFKHIEQQNLRGSKALRAAGPSVFLSHSSNDKMFVRRLAADLQKKRIRVWLDEREILVGDSLHRRIAEGVEKTDFLVLVLSQASIQSGWVEREVNAGLMRELERKQVVVLPILIDKAAANQIPPLLRDRKYANFARNYDEGLHELLYSIRAHQRRRRTTRN